MEKVIWGTVAETEARFEELTEGVLRREWRWSVVREDGGDVEVVPNVRKRIPPCN